MLNAKDWSSLGTNPAQSGLLKEQLVNPNIPNFKKLGQSGLVPSGQGETVKALGAEAIEDLVRSAERWLAG
jgi:hypothetical protein